MQRSLTSKTLIVTDPLFSIDFMVVMGGTREDALKKFNKRTGEQLPEVEHNERQRGWVYTYNRSGAPILIWLHASAWAGIVAHEVFHAVYAALSNRAVPLSNDTEEVYAYYIQWLFNEIAPKLPGWRIKK